MTRQEIKSINRAYKDLKKEIHKQAQLKRSDWGSGYTFGILPVAMLFGGMVIGGNVDPCTISVLVWLACCGLLHGVKVHKHCKTLPDDDGLDND